MRPPLARTTLIVVLLAFGLSACGEGDAERFDLTSMLTERAQLSDSEADCVADAVFEPGLYTQDELNKASKNPSEVDGFQELVDELGFQELVDEALATCMANG